MCQIKNIEKMKIKSDMIKNKVKTQLNINFTSKLMWWIGLILLENTYSFDAIIKNYVSDIYVGQIFGYE